MTTTETPSVVAGETPTTAPTETVTPAPTDAMSVQSTSFTLEEALKRIADLEHSQKNAVEEVGRHRKKLSAYEKAEQESNAVKKAAEEAQLSEIERTKKQLAELQASHQVYSQRMQEKIVQNDIEKHATKLGIIDPEAAFKLLDMAELEFSESGEPTNASDLLKKLLKNKPYLGPSVPANNSAPKIPAMNPGRTSISPPVPEQAPPKFMRLADYYNQKR